MNIFFNVNSRKFWVRTDKLIRIRRISFKKKVEEKVKKLPDQANGDFQTVFLLYFPPKSSKLAAGQDGSSHFVISKAVF